MKFKRILAWCLVLVVGYVTVYTYLHPEYVQYYERMPLQNEEYNPDIPIGEENILMKDKNPFVYYALELQGYLITAGLIWWLVDWKRSKKFFAKFEPKED